MFDCRNTLLTFTRAALLAVMTFALGGPAFSADWPIPIVNQANATFGFSGNTATITSNTTSAAVMPNAAKVRFFANANYVQETEGVDAGDPLYIEGSAEACDADVEKADITFIDVTSASTGDSERVLAVETASHTNIFRFEKPLPTTTSASAPNDGVLSVQKDDVLTSVIEGCGTGTATDTVAVDPSGVLFDSQTNETIQGARVTLSIAQGSMSASQVVKNAGVTARRKNTLADKDNSDLPGSTPPVDTATSQFPMTVVTDAEGRYEFPQVGAGTYVIDIAPPGNYHYPSTRTGEQLPAGREVLADGSYNAQFVVDANTKFISFDTPLDASPQGSLFLEKTASRQTAEIAESIEYTLTLKNVGGFTVNRASIRDDLPHGFTYVPGTTRINGVKAADPTGGKGPKIFFAVPALADGESALITYRALLGPGALQSDGINRAVATSNSPAITSSNTATAAVKVTGGVFDDNGYVLGKIFADCNRNHLQDAGEPGIPGVRMYMEDGSFIITDSNGQYSFYDVSPRTHVLKVDSTTLPAGAKLAAISHRHAGDGNSRFVDVTRGELHRADFATDGCPEELDASIHARVLAAQMLTGEMTRGVKTELNVDSNAPIVGDARALPSSGVIGEKNGVPVATQDTTTVAAQPAMRSLDTLMPTLTNEIGFIDLQDGQNVRSNQLAIRVKGHADTHLKLSVNGNAIDDSRIGTRTTAKDTQTEALEYIGVDLEPGRNELTLTQSDDFGNVRATRSIHINAPGDLARIVLTPPAAAIAADGTSLARIHVELQDSNGLPYTSRTAVTLENSAGDWQVADDEVNIAGVQTFIENGSADFDLIAPSTPGDVNVRIGTSRLHSDAKISFRPLLRPMMAVGVVEGALNLKKLNPHALTPASSDDGFEQELNNFASGDAKNTAGGRAALFLKGKVRGDYLLTLGYDSDKDTSQRLFRDIQPDKFYPVYGDDSVKGFDAQSTGRLYVRVDRNKSYLLAGDFTTQGTNLARDLSAYNRSLNGVREHFENDRVMVDAFAAHDSTTQIIQEIPANGTSGPFTLSTANMRENSEKVEIITRDRNQPSVIISSTTLQRFSDYEIEAFTGQLIMRAPVTSFDQELNRNFIRVTYEVDTGGDSFWVGGVDTQFRVTDQFSVGGSYAQDQNPIDGQRLAGANSTLKLGDATTLITEVAHSDRDIEGSGWGERTELRHEDAKLRLRAFAGHTDADFNNQSASLSPDRTEVGAKGNYVLNDRTRLVGEALDSQDVTTNAERYGGLFGVERSFEHNLKAELGMRYVHNEPATGSTPQETDTTSIRTKVSAPLPSSPRTTVFGEYEQDVQDFDRRMAAIGGEYQLANRSRLYLRHEFITSLSGPYSLDPTVRQNTTVFGMDTRYMKDDRVFSEYRIGDGINGRDAQAAIGLRNGWTVADGIKLNTTVERVTTVSGPADDTDASAVAGALEYTRNPLWKGTARLEYRTSDTSDSWFSTFGLAHKLSDDWTFLGKNVLATTTYKNGQPERMQDRMQLGLAYRDSETNLVNGLARYEFRHEKDGKESGIGRNVHIISTHANFQVNEKLVLEGQYAGKLAQETSTDGIRISSVAHLIGTRLTRDLGNKFDIGVAARSLFSAGFGSRQSSVGAEVGYLIKDNVWISGGFNITGFHDKDLSEEEYTNRGAFVRLRMKFDENVFAKR